MRLAAKSGIVPMLSPSTDITKKNAAKLTTTAISVAKSHTRKQPQPIVFRSVVMVFSYLNTDQYSAMKGGLTVRAELRGDTGSFYSPRNSSAGSTNLPTVPDSQVGSSEFRPRLDP